MIAAVVLAGAALLGSPPCKDPLVLRIPSSWYVSLVARYRGGGREAAVAESIPSERFLGEIAELGALLSYHKRHRGCPVPAFLEAVTSEPVVTLKAAVMLHTDRAFLVLEWDDPAARAELALAPLLLELMDVSARRAFETRWARACAIELSRRGQYGLALTLLDPAMKRYPDDPWLLLAQGAALESKSRLERNSIESTGVTAFSVRGGRMRAGPREIRAQLESAESCYRQALAARPDLTEARVRLARVLQLMGRSADSIPELQAVVAADAAPIETRDLYLAHLFLGDAHETAGRLDRAADEYEQAARALPDGQAAAVALSHALHRFGRWPASVEALQTGVARAGRRLVMDPWWPYVAGQTEDPAALFEALRAEVTL